MLLCLSHFLFLGNLDLDWDLGGLGVWEEDWGGVLSVILEVCCGCDL